MKINDINRTGMVNPYRKAMTAPPATRTHKHDKKADNVQFSEAGRKLLEAAADPERAAKISRLKESVATGTYHVEAGKIAEKLLPYLMDHDY